MSSTITKNIYTSIYFVLTAVSPLGLQVRCRSLSQLHMGEGRVGKVWDESLQSLPYVSISGFNTLLKGTLAVL